MTDDLNALKTKIVGQRRAGVFHLTARELTSSEIDEFPPAVLDSFMTQLGFRAIGDEWHEINLPDARIIIFKILKKDMAYESPLMTDDDANAFTDEILSVLRANQDSRFFTNGNYHNQCHTWYSVSLATFNTGVIVLNDENIGMTFVEDED